MFKPGNDFTEIHERHYKDSKNKFPIIFFLIISRVGNDYNNHMVILVNFIAAFFERHVVYCI